MDQFTDEMTQHELHDTPTTSEWMMLCLPRVDGLCNLHQLEFTQRPTTTTQFLARLKSEYSTRRTRPFPNWGILSPRERKLTEIRFVKFDTIFTPPTPLVRVVAERCLSEDEEGWVFDPHGDPSEASVGAGLMMAWCLNGYDVARAAKGLYELVPRKLHEPLPRECRLYGWGLHFVEEEYFKGWYVGVVVVGTSAVAYVGGIVFALLVTKAYGLIGLLPTAADGLALLRMSFAIVCLTVAFAHLSDYERMC